MEGMMRQTWMLGMTLAALVAAPAFVDAQSTTTETKVAWNQRGGSRASDA
jgi:hypothetical protein